MSDTLPSELSKKPRPIAPLLKWPGGKRRLLHFILPLIPRKFDRYYEPFLGSGALFFALQPRQAFLSDKNADLIYAYNQIRNNPGAVIKHIAGLRNTERDYYAVRADTPRSGAKRAARLELVSKMGEMT